jgi:hypothetical protein
MTTHNEALKMAIEGMVKAEKVFDDIGLLLIKFGVNPSDINFHKESFLAPAIQACKEALERPSNMVVVPLDKLQDMQRRLKPLAQPQKQWVGLTTRQIKHIEEKSYVLQTGVNDYEFDFIHFAKAIEAKLKKLNAPEKG